MWTVLVAASAQAQDLSFREPAELPGRIQAFFVAVGDFNGDMVQDLAVVNQNSDTVSVLLGAWNFPAGTTPVSVAVGDFTGDGRPDLALSNRDSNQVSVLINNTGL